MLLRKKSIKPLGVFPDPFRRWLEILFRILPRLPAPRGRRRFFQLIPDNSLPVRGHALPYKRSNSSLPIFGGIVAYLGDKRSQPSGLVLLPFLALVLEPIVKGGSKVRPKTKFLWILWGGSGRRSRRTVDGFSCFCVVVVDVVIDGDVVVVVVGNDTST